jgi:hypothetical protein
MVSGPDGRQSRKISQGRRTFEAMNSILWEQRIKKETKMRIYKSIVQSVMLYGSEIWDLSRDNRKKLMSTEMDFLRRSAGRSRLERVRNEDIRVLMGVTGNI